MLTVAVDGSALGNPGPAGWAWYIDQQNWAAGGWKRATNNRGELQAVIEILQASADSGQDLRLLADSQYVINSVTKWMPGWKKKGWKKRDGKDVLNKDQMVRIDELMTAAKAAGRDVSFTWVKGHAGHELNEYADERAHGAALAFQRGQDVQAGPGLSGEVAAASARPAGTVQSEETAAASPSVQPVAGKPGDAAEGEHGLVVVSAPVERALADAIVSRAQAAGRTPQAELAELIALGMERKYSK